MIYNEQIRLLNVSKVLKNFKKLYSQVFKN